MMEFLLAAYPWIGIGIAVAIVITYSDARMKRENK